MATVLLLYNHEADVKLTDGMLVFVNHALTVNVPPTPGFSSHPNADQTQNSNTKAKSFNSHHCVFL